MRTSPRPGAPTSTSSNRSTSGPPYLSKRNALLMPPALSKGVSSSRADVRRQGEAPERSGRDRLEVESQRLHHARVHVVAADENGQFHDLAGVEMTLDLGEDLVRHHDVAGHGVGIGERSALAIAEQVRPVPLGERIAIVEREPL